MEYETTLDLRLTFKGPIIIIHKAGVRCNASSIYFDEKGSIQYSDVLCSQVWFRNIRGFDAAIMCCRHGTPQELGVVNNKETCFWELEESIRTSSLCRD